jgi:hypothetical protein
MLDISLRGFSLSNCPQYSLKVLLLLNPMHLLKTYTQFFIFQSGLARVYATRNLRVGKERPARKTDNLTAMYEPIF